MPVEPPFVDSRLLPSAGGVDLPTIGPHEYVLVDDDEKVCRVITDDEFDESYVDNHIHTFRLRGVDWLTLAVDKELVDIVYSGGRRATLRLGSISFERGRRATQYAKSRGLIYPIDDHGRLLLNGSNTPRLVAMREWYHKEVRRVIDERVKIAEIVHVFAQAVGASGNAAH